MKVFSSRDAVIKKISKFTHSYADWQKKAEEYDKEHGWDIWRIEDHSDLYDHEEIRMRLEKLRKLRQNGDDQGLLFTLNEGIHGNMAGMGNHKLFAKALTGTKQLIVDYTIEVAEALEYLAKVDETIISLEDKLDFFHRASHCFGRTALMLSGGGQLGNFHIGVLKALIDENLLPNVISGSSAGSIFAALSGTLDDEELKFFFKPENLLLEVKKDKGFVNGMFKKRTAVKVHHLKESIERVIPNLTFQEAYEKTGKHINISVAPSTAHQKSRLLNAVASPNVMVRSAVLASCAIPGIYPAVTLYAKNKNGQEVPYLSNRKWVDGSMSNDLPSKRLSRIYGVNHFIVSLTNPFILPFVSDPLNQNDFMSAVSRFTKSLVKETTQFNYSIAKPLFKYWPKLAMAASGLNSVIQQDYLGDINITADFSVVKPSNLLSTLTTEELAEMIRKGEKATWPKIEAIRVTTMISKVLDKILEELDTEELERGKKAIKKAKSGVK